MACSRLSREGVHSRVHGPAHHVDGPRPHRWAWMVFQNGESDDVCQGVPAHARPRVRILARVATSVIQVTDTCLRSRCAGETPSNDMAVTATTTDLPPASPPPSPLPPRRFSSPQRCRSDSCSWLRLYGLLGTRQLPGVGRFARILCGILLGIALGVREGWDGRSGELQST